MTEEVEDTVVVGVMVEEDVVEELRGGLADYSKQKKIGNLRFSRFINKSQKQAS